MVKILKISLQDFQLSTQKFSIVRVSVYPREAYYMKNNKTIYLPRVFPDYYINVMGFAEIPLVPNDILYPQPNFYIVKILNKLQMRMFVVRLESTLPDPVDLKDVIIYPKLDEKFCVDVDYKLIGKDTFI